MFTTKVASQRGRHGLSGTSTGAPIHSRRGFPTPVVLPRKPILRTKQSNIFTGESDRDAPSKNLVAQHIAAYAPQEGVQNKVHSVAWLEVVFNQESALNEDTCCFEKRYKPVKLRRIAESSSNSSAACKVHEKGAPHKQQIGDVAQFANERAEVTLRNHILNKKKPVKLRRNLPGPAAVRTSCALKRNAASNILESVTLMWSQRRMAGKIRDDEGGVFATSASSEYFRFIQSRRKTPRQQVTAVRWPTSLANQRCVRGPTTHSPTTPQHSVDGVGFRTVGRDFTVSANWTNGPRAQ